MPRQIARKSRLPGEPDGLGSLGPDFPSERAERERLLGPMLENVESLARRASDAMQRELPAYTEQPESFLADVFDQICKNYTTLLKALIEDRAPTAAELSFQRGASMRRARAGFALEDYLSAYRVAQQVLWDAIMAYSETAEVDHRLVLTLAGQLMRSMDLATTHAGHAYVEFRQHALAALATERRDLLEHLLAGSRPTSGPLAATADRYGIESRASLLVAVGVPLAAAADRHSLELASATFARVGLQEPGALVVIRQNEIVTLGRVGAHHDAHSFCVRLEEGEADLRREGSPLAIGVSTVATGIAELPAAYKEAAAAIRFVDREGGVAALPRLTPFEYLTLNADQTVRRLINPKILSFLRDDRRRGGALTATLQAFAGCDFRLKDAAATLHVHPNTLQYRLQRVADITGLNPRRFTDIHALLLAIALEEKREAG